MLAVPVFNMQGERTGEMEVDPAVLGGEVRAKLMKQAVVAYLDHQRQRSARNKGRAHVEGSTRKLYRQKGTGRARMGNIRTPIRRGGGNTFAKRLPGRIKDFPKKMRRAARNSAILAKIEAADALVVENLQMDAPKTRVMAGMLKALEVDRGCVLALAASDDRIYLAGRNIPKLEVRAVSDLNTYEILRRRKLVFSKEAFQRLLEGSAWQNEAAMGGVPQVSAEDA
jgi:large subunit ribosomal protein L4